MTELQPIIDLLLGKWPWLIKLATFIGFARLAIKPIGWWIKNLITRAAEKASLSIDSEDDTFIEHILRAPAYRLFAFLLDLFASVKLPLAEDLFKPKTSPL